jgi:hypothetical protein
VQYEPKQKEKKKLLSSCKFAPLISYVLVVVGTVGMGIRVAPPSSLWSWSSPNNHLSIFTVGKKKNFQVYVTWLMYVLREAPRPDEWMLMEKL